MEFIPLVKDWLPESLRTQEVSKHLKRVNCYDYLRIVAAWLRPWFATGFRQTGETFFQRREIIS